MKVNVNLTSLSSLSLVYNIPSVVDLTERWVLHCSFAVDDLIQTWQLDLASAALFLCLCMGCCSVNCQVLQ